jgi:hypothetical protein
MPEKFIPQREQLSRLSYSQLNELFARLLTMAEASRNPPWRADIMAAAHAVSDLASIKFCIRELGDEVCDYAARHEGEAHHEQIIQFMAQLDSLIGRESES